MSQFQLNIKIKINYPNSFGIIYTYSGLDSNYPLVGEIFKKISGSGINTFVSFPWRWTIAGKEKLGSNRPNPYDLVVGSILDI